MHILVNQKKPYISDKGEPIYLDKQYININCAVQKKLSINIFNEYPSVLSAVNDSKINKKSQMSSFSE